MKLNWIEEEKEEDEDTRWYVTFGPFAARVYEGYLGNVRIGIGMMISFKDHGRIFFSAHTSIDAAKTAAENWFINHIEEIDEAKKLLESN